MKQKTIGIIIAAILLTAGITGFIIWNTAYRFTGAGKSIGSDGYHAEFDSFNGTDRFEMQLNAGEKLLLDAQIEKGKAEVAFGRCGEAGGTVIRDLADTETELTADADGRYEIRISAKHAKGAIHISTDENIRDKTVYRTGKH